LEQVVEIEMSNKSEESADRAAQLSALMDGELEADALDALCDDWRREPDLRMRWHSYQLVGDVLRSEDLASTASRDAAFLQRVRLQLEAEPVVLAPQPLPVPALSPTAAGAPSSRPRRAWRNSAAVAAGFVVVAVGAVSLMRPPSVVIETAAVPGRQDSNTGPTSVALNGNLIRDARLDQYLAAHQQLAGGSLLGGHAAFLRQAATDAPRR
jgi:sigma-E factor negative regulatory protein RseA